MERHGDAVMKKTSMINHLERQFERKKVRIIIRLSILLSMPAIYFLVYYTGGIKYVFSHTMYIPIILAGILFGPKVSFVVAIIAGILMGPLMPIDTVTQESQLWYNWMYRLLIFIVIAFLSGYSSKLLKHRLNVIEGLSLRNIDTKIPNVYALFKSIDIFDHRQQLIASLILNNADDIIDVIGLKNYHQFLGEIYKDIRSSLCENCEINKMNISQKNHLCNHCEVIQADYKKLWIIKPFIDDDQDPKRFVDLIFKDRSFGGIPLYVDYSVGFTIVDTITNDNQLDFFKHADLSALYARTHNLSFAFFKDEMKDKQQDYLILSSFSQAIQNNDLYLVYQPKIDLKTGIPCGLEALIRWEHPILGLIPPNQFIHLVESTNYINPLTDFVLTQSIEMIKSLKKEKIDVDISINVSAKNILDKHFYERVKNIIETSDVNINHIEFEITESILIQNPQHSKEVLKKLSHLGIKISFDDFGSGYSSLAYLDQFPVDIIKIDRLFMNQIEEKESLQHIVSSTIDLSKKLGYLVVIEGIETEEVLDLVKSYGADIGQGYYFSKPMSKDETIIWYKNHRIQK
jgi:diguanylate cyclase